MTGFASELKLAALAEDPDKETDKSNGLNLTWDCKNLNTGGVCKDINDKTLTINPGGLAQQFGEKVLKPYNSYWFKFKAQSTVRRELVREENSNCIIVVIELHLIALSAEYDKRFINEKLNLNEIFEFLTVIDIDPDLLTFSVAPIYEFDMIATI